MFYTLGIGIFYGISILASRQQLLNVTTKLQIKWKNPIIILISVNILMAFSFSFTLFIFWNSARMISFLRQYLFHKFSETLRPHLTLSGLIPSNGLSPHYLPKTILVSEWQCQSIYNFIFVFTLWMDFCSPKSSLFY